MKRCPHIILILATILLVAADKKPEKAKKPVPSAEQVQLWVKQLGDDDIKVREEAMRNLSNSGESAIDAVTKATKSEDAEVKQRALKILKKLVRANLQGTWKVTSMEFDGKQTKSTKTNKESIIIAENTVTFAGWYAEEKKSPKSTFKIDATKTPKQITVITAATKELGGSTVLGIFRQQGDKLELCFDGPLYLTGKRPTKFNAKEGISQVYYKLKRIQ